MTGLDVVDAVMLFFGYVFVATAPLVCVLKYEKTGLCDPFEFFEFFGAIASVWWIIVMATLFSMHDFIFYFGVIG